MFDAMMMDLLMRNPEMLNMVQRNRGPKKVKCPVCNEEHDHSPAPNRGRIEDRYSHDARVSFLSASCPVCLEDNAGPPMVNQACGHMVCPVCFQQLGGKIGEDAMLSSEEVARREEAEREANSDDNNNTEEGLRALMNAVLMRNEGMPPAMIMPGMLPPGMLPPGFGYPPDDEDDFDDDYEDDEDEEDSDYEDMPPLLGDDGEALEESEDVSDDGLPSRARNAAADGNANASGAIPPAADHQPLQQNDQDGADDSDDDSDMPALIPRQNSDMDSDDSSDDDSDIPPLIPRNNRDDSDSDESESSDSESSLPPLLPRGDRNNDSESEEDEDSDSDSSMPPLLARARNNEDSSDEESDHDSDSDSMPRLFRPLDQRRDEASSSDSDMPDLVPKDPCDYSDDEEAARATSSEDEDEMPDLTPTRQPSKSREELMKEEKEKAKQMKAGQLKRELRKMGIPTTSFVEKGELEEAYVNAVMDKKMPAADPEAEAPRPAPPAPPVDPYADMPGLMPAKDPPKNGAWILTPKTDDDHLMELVYAYVDESQVESKVYGEFAKGATLLTGLDGSTWVYAHNSSSDKWEIHLVKEIDLQVKMYDFDNAAKLTVDGHHGLWALCPDENSRDEYHKLVRINARYPEGMRIRGNIPSDTRLIMDRSGGTWLVVPSQGSSAASLQPGLWHFTVSSSNRVLNDISDNAKVIYDSDRRGLWILSPVGSGKSNLMHIDSDGGRKEEEIDVDITNAREIIDDGADGVYIHCRIGERWKLCRAAQGRNNMEVVVDCPKASWITNDGEGGVWIWKKSGKTANRMLTHVDTDSNTCEREERFPAGSVMGGIP